MRRKLINLLFVSLLIVTAVGAAGCFHHTADRAADALRDAVKKRTN